ncbi:MAG: helix-turn-helix transcriptional regulator [Bacteroidota bacterium]
MKDTKLGELEELILLTVVFLQEDAYNVRIREELKAQANRQPTMGALYTALTRLEKKDFLTSEMTGAEDIREGRRKRVYEVTAAGKEALHDAHQLRNKLWNQIAQLNLDWKLG